MRSSVKWAAALIVLALLAPYRAGALGLGDIKLQSYLNERLNADIAVTPASGEDLGDARVVLASPDAFAKAGIDRPDVLNDLHFTLEKGANGKTRIHVSSDAPIKEPFLDFILQVSWSKGELLREYTVLLDPPVTVDESAPAVQPAVAGNAASAPSAAANTSAAAVTAPAAAQAAPSQPAAATATATSPEGAAATAIPTRSISPQLTKDSYGPTQRTDTLWSIAKAIRPGDAVSIQQVMLALVKQNPDAFYGGNVNALKAGYILRLPDMDMMTAVAQADAVRTVERQYHQWLQARQAGVQPGEATPPGGMIARGGQTGAGEPQGRLKLLPADTTQNGSAAAGANGGAGKGAGNQQLAAALEDSEAQKQENAQLQSQLNELNDQVKSLQRLLTLKDDTLAALQQKLAQLQGQPAGATTAAPASPASSATAADHAQLAGATAAPSASPAPAAAAAAHPAPATAAQTPAPAVKPRPVHAASKPPVVHAQSPWQDPKVIAIGGVVVLLVGALAWVVVRRRHMDSENFVPAAGTAGVPAPAAEGAAAAPAAAASTEDYAPTGGDLLETEVDEIDPLAEADVYMAYRRYQQAEDLLKSAIEQEPNRQELRMKLLEVYASAENAPAFMAAAETFYDEFGGGDNPLWDKVSAMGRDVQPDHPLFNGVGPAAGEDSRDMDEQADADVTAAAVAAPRDAGAASSDDDDLGAALLAGLPGGGTADGTDGDDSEAGDSGLIEYEAGLSHQLDTTVPPEPVPVVTGNEIDFNLDTGAAGGGATDGAGLDAVASAAVDAGAEDGSADLAERDRAFNLDFEAVGGDKDLDNFFEGLDTLDAAEEEPHDASLDGQEDVGTKLDLAKAFIEMGDQDGAKEVLKEVMDAGDDDQKREAQGLLRTLEADA